MGRKKIAAECLEYLLLDPAIHVVGVMTDSHTDHSPTKEIANRHKLPLLTLESARNLLKKGSLHFDIAFSMLYWRILDRSFLDAAKYGIVNFHPAPLPAYKGVGGYNLAVLHSLKSWSVTAHYMDESIDTGPILSLIHI